MFVSTRLLKVAISRSLMLVVVKRMFDQISINNKVAVAGTTFPLL